MNTKIKWNRGWLFARQPLTDDSTPTDTDNFSWKDVNLPHDWLISDCSDLYADSVGWYRKVLITELTGNEEYLLYFEGVYMDCTIYVNGHIAGEWKYGYSSFEIRLTPWLNSGSNTILVRVRYQSPNSRWYSGAGIYRNVWLKKVPLLHIASDGIAVETHLSDGVWNLTVHTLLEKDGCRFQAETPDLIHRLTDAQGKTVLDNIPENTCVSLSDVNVWDTCSPYLYRLESILRDSNGIIQRELTTFGFRTILADPEHGFFLNGRHIKLNGVCQHHDLGVLGSAVNRSAIRRQLDILRSMGCNAIRTSHNMPAVELLELADETGMLIVDEAFDMWERSKNTYDYARFFREWHTRDTESWIRRDINHPSVIMWSIGNEIYDTHADEEGLRITKELLKLVKKYDPWNHAYATIGSNYMTWENAQKCADVIKLAGYNYTEKLYEKHHRQHPDWIIYGSETSSVVQSRGIYHFPLKQPVLADDDLQCSALGNSSTSWGAKSQQFCVLAERDTPFSLGQFLWSGFDYIGEPTPYHTRNSYFGQIDTAGFPKDSYYFYKSAWTDFIKEPVIHILPYWDFNPGQLIDVRVYTNAPAAELFLNGSSLGKRVLDHEHGKVIIADWQIPYTEGTLLAVCYDENGLEAAREEISSFGDAASLRLSADRVSVPANGQELVFVTIDALDSSGRETANARSRIHIRVEGEGKLCGLDNGDSTDPDPYRCSCRSLFSGKLLAVIAPALTPGKITVTASSKGLQPASLVIDTTPCRLTDEDCEIYIEPDRLAGKAEADNSIPVRKAELICGESRTLTPKHSSAVVRLVIHPADADYSDVSWRITNAAGVDVSTAKLSVINDSEVCITGLSDGDFYLRCSCCNNRNTVQFYSQLDFKTEGMGTKNLDPYEFISGALYCDHSGEISNGNEHGAATARDGVTEVVFGPLDFGSFGSDTLTIPIFELDSKPVNITFYELTENKQRKKLGTYTYDKKSIWNVYQEQTFVLPRRLKGITYLSIQVEHKIHIKGFSFEKQIKALSVLSASQADAVYGDTFSRSCEAITGIGNNVSLEFNDMDFGSLKKAVLEITGRSLPDKNTIHIRMSNGEGEILNIAEFIHSEEYSMQRFEVSLLPGTQKVTFLFLPGSCFDFRSFQFIPADSEK